MLSHAVSTALMERFGDKVRIDLSSTQFASFEPKHPDVGSVIIEEDGNELIVFVGNITHGHFGSYEDSLSPAEHEAVIIHELIGFLEDLFEDRYLVFKGRWGGGWAPVEDVTEKKLHSRRRRWFKWSGPLDFSKN